MTNPHRSVQRGLRAACQAGAAWVVCAGLLIGTAQAADPAWWQTRGAVNASAAPAPYAVVNQGQLKAFTVAAVQEMNAALAGAGGAGADLNNLVSSWHQDYVNNGYATNHSNPTYPYKPADFSAVRVGQLKYIASLIYGRLQAAGCLASYPAWIRVNPAADKTLANLGQLKTVFNFDLSLDPGGSGLPVAWEQNYFHQTGVSGGADPDGDGLTNLQEYQYGLNPTASSTAGDLYTDGWKVNHNLNPHHVMVADDPAAPVVKLVVFTPLW